MRFTSLIVCTITALQVGQAIAVDTSAEEKECSEIGFKRKTEPFANCVLELTTRRSGSKASSASSQLTPDDATCRRYGFKPNTDNYATCRQQIEIARQDAYRQQVEYDRRKAEYERLVAEQKKERDREKGLAMLQAGLGMMSGKPNASNSSGMLTAPTPPQISNQTYILPGGRMMNCSTTGNVTSCN